MCILCLFVFVKGVNHCSRCGEHAIRIRRVRCVLCGVRHHRVHSLDARASGVSARHPAIPVQQSVRIRAADGIHSCAHSGVFHAAGVDFRGASRVVSSGQVSWSYGYLSWHSMA